MNLSQFKFGWIPDLPDARDLQFKAAPKALRMAALKPVCDDIRPLIKSIPCYDQGSIGSCTGNMGAAAVIVQQARQRRQLVTPSRLALYYDARALHGWQNQDTGAFIRDIFKVLAKQGAGAESLWPYKESKFKIKPPLSYYDKADDQNVLKYERVEQSLSQMKAVLAEGNPICLGFTVYDSFSDAGLDGIASLPGKYDRAQGGHAVLVVGYTNDLKAVHSRGSKLKLPSFAKQVKEWFIVRNSWSPKWGDKGYFYMPVDYLTNANLAADLWRLQLLE